MANRHDTPRNARSAASARGASQQQLSLPGLAPLTDLPFIKDVKVNADRSRRRYWKVGPPTRNNLHDQLEGGMYAWFFVNHLHANPSGVGQDVLAHIITDMADNKHGIRTGYVQGFFGMLQHMIMRGSTVASDEANLSEKAQVARPVRAKEAQRRRASLALVGPVASTG